MKKIVTLLKVRIVTIFALRNEIHMDQSFHYLSMVMHTMVQSFSEQSSGFIENGG